MKMKIVVDENIPLGKEAFGTIGEVVLCAGRAIDNSVVKNADALVVRSITKVNESLLENTSIKFVGTATIGTDHIDQEYLAEKNIAFSSAAGCNSYSVVEYVFSAITYFAEKYNFDISKKSIGVVGYGNIGTKVIKVADALGMTSVINDPPLERETDNNTFSSLEDALACDIVTFHVPLNKNGIDKTVHLLNENNIGLIKDGAILINASRGPVISNKVLKERLLENNNIYTVLDVWETEPNFDSELFQLVEIGTPHIAGYSFEGKVNGTTMIYEALSNFLKLEKTWKPLLNKVKENFVAIEKNESVLSVLIKLFNKSYNVMDDDAQMRKCVDYPDGRKSECFDSLRKKYRKRRELNNFEVNINFENDKLQNLLNVLRVK